MVGMREGREGGELWWLGVGKGGSPPTDALGHKAMAVLVALQVPARAGHQIAHAHVPASSSDPTAGHRLPLASTPASWSLFPLASGRRVPAGGARQCGGGGAGPCVAVAEVGKLCYRGARCAVGLGALGRSLPLSFPFPFLLFPLLSPLCFSILCGGSFHYFYSFRQFLFFYNFLIIIQIHEYTFTLISTYIHTLYLYKHHKKQKKLSR